MARLTLIQASAVKSVILTVPAPGTLKALWPANLEKIFQTLVGPNQIDPETQATTLLDISPIIPLATQFSTG